MSRKGDKRRELVIEKAYGPDRSLTWAEAEASYPGCSPAWDRDACDAKIDLHLQSCAAGVRLYAYDRMCQYIRHNGDCTCWRFDVDTGTWVMLGHKQYRPPYDRS